MSDQAFENDPLLSLADAGDATETSTEAEAVQPEEGQGQPDATIETSEVQPEGQGREDAETGLYDELLSTVPEEYHEQLRAAAEGMNRNVNAKLQEAAEYRKSWEAFSDLNLQDVGAESIGALLEFAQDVSNPETARDALMAIAEAVGVDLGAVEAAAAEGGQDDDNDVPLTRAEFEAWQAQQRAEFEENQRLIALQAEAHAQYTREFNEVEKLNGKPFGTQPGPNGEPSERQELINLAARFRADHDEPIKAAYQWMRKIRGQAEAALVNSQPKSPAVAEKGGRASSTVQPVDDFDTALRLHLERNASAST